MKWVPVIIVLAVAGFFAWVAVEYFTVGIHSIPSWFPGYKATVAGHHHGPRGHYRKGGAGAALVAFILLIIAGWLTFRNVNSRQTTGPSTPATV